MLSNELRTDFYIKSEAGHTFNEGAYTYPAPKARKQPNNTWISSEVIRIVFHQQKKNDSIPLKVDVERVIGTNDYVAELPASTPMQSSKLTDYVTFIINRKYRLS